MRTLVIGLVYALVSTAALAQESGSSTLPAEGDKPDGWVTLSGGSVAAGIGFSWGNGELNYSGNSHHFKMSGLSLVDVGATSISGSGTVYNLHSLDDFSGNYTAASAGMTIAGGGSAVWLRNQHGVVIKVVTSEKGLKFNLAAHGVNVTLKD